MATTIDRSPGGGVKLRKVLRRFDLVLFTACAIVALDTVAFAAGIGGEVIFWLGIALIFFLLPYGMIVAELGSAFPAEGGPYVWSRMAFGRLAGTTSAFLYWVANPVWLGGTIAATVIATLNSFVFAEPLGKWAEIAIALAYVWICFALATVSLGWGKWAPNIGSIVKIVVVGIFVVLVIAFLVNNGRPSGTIVLSDLKPTTTGFLAAVGILVFLLVGFELSSGAGEEIVNPQRDVPAMIFASGLIAALLYGLTIVGILLVIPRGDLTNVASFTDAYSSVASVLGGAARGFGYVFAALIIIMLIGTGAVWLDGANRVQAASALDGAAPKWLGRFSKAGTPIASNLAFAVSASVFVFFVFMITGGSLVNFFTVMIALAISSAALCYLFVIPALLVLRKKHPDVERPYRVPGGKLGAWVAVILTEAFVVVTGITLLWPGLIDSLFGQSYPMEDYWGVSRVFFETVTLGTFGAFLLISVVFWLVGKRDLARGDVGEAVPPQ